ncbi:MAG: ABC transporter substrate-binding protein [Actinomycetaceae bacterium]|nr:ABC transporter substrate-binding protein [Actinomycetaceae bacterium]
MRKTAAILLASALALSLAACGGSGDTDKKDTNAGANTEVLATDLSGVKTNDEIAAMVPDAVKADGKLTIGDNVFYAPAEFYAPDGKTAQGYDIDFAKALAKVMGLEADIQDSEFDSIISGIGSKYEVGIANFTITPERLEVVNMVQYFSTGSLWGVKAGNPDGFDPKNPCGAVVGVQKGTFQDETIDALNEKCPNDKKMQIQRYSEESAVTMAVAGGKLKAFYADSAVAEYAVKTSNKALEVVGEPDDMAGIGVAISKSDEQLTKAIQAAIQDLIKNGHLANIFSTWGIKDGVATEAILNPKN